MDSGRNPIFYETNTPEETFELGRQLGEHAKAGEIYTLSGNLGVGKTVFTQGIAAGWSFSCQ